MKGYRRQWRGSFLAHAIAHKTLGQTHTKSEWKEARIMQAIIDFLVSIPLLGGIFEFIWNLISGLF